MAHRLNLTAITLVFILAFFSFSFAQETLTITTYYPSPYGSYRELRSVKMAIGSSYYDRANVCWAFGSCPGTCPAGSTCIPDTSTLDLIVEGDVSIGTANPTPPAPAAFYIHSTNAQVGNIWMASSGYDFTYDGGNDQYFLFVNNGRNASSRTSFYSGDPAYPGDSFLIYNDGRAYIPTKPGNPNSGLGIGMAAGAGLNSRLDIKGRTSNNTSNSLNVMNSSNNPLLFVRNDGNVGVGTNSPSQALDVNGQVRIRQGGPQSGRVLTATNNSGDAQWQNISASLDCIRVQATGGTGGDARIDVSCPLLPLPRRILTGGGCWASSGTDDTVSWPSTNNTWSCREPDASGHNSPLTVYAICCRVQ